MSGWMTNPIHMLKILRMPSLHIRMGQCPVKNYNERLLHLIETGRIDPTPLISHTMSLDEAPKAYEMFGKKDGVTKVILKP